MNVFFFADDRQEYLELLSQSASRHTLDFPSRCLMSKSRSLSWSCLARRGRSRARSEKRIAIFREGWRLICGRSASIPIRWTNGKVRGHS